MSQSATLTDSKCAIVYMYNKKLALASMKASRLGPASISRAWMLIQNFEYSILWMYIYVERWANAYAYCDQTMSWICPARCYSIKLPLDRKIALFPWVIPTLKLKSQFLFLASHSPIHRILVWCLMPCAASESFQWRWYARDTLPQHLYI